MTRPIRILLCMCCAAALSATACAPEPYTRLNAPPQGEGDSRPVWADYYTYHNDQAMLADMSIADLHFVPHSTELSGVGQARLERYAELLAGRGGTLYYDTAIEDETLLASRIDTARQFLAQAIPGQQRVELVVGPPGGRGMDAREQLSGQAVAKQAEPRQNAYRLRKYSTEGDQ